jgi:hypothetical protein
MDGEPVMGYSLELGFVKEMVKTRSWWHIWRGRLKGHSEQFWRGAVVHMGVDERCRRDIRYWGLGWTDTGVEEMELEANGLVVSPMEYPRLGCGRRG